MFLGSVRGIGYPFPIPCVTVCHQVSKALYFAVCYAVCSLQSLVQDITKLLLAAACNDLHSFEGRLYGGSCRGSLLDDDRFRWWTSEHTATSFEERSSSVFRVEFSWVKVTYLLACSMKQSPS